MVSGVYNFSSEEFKKVVDASCSIANVVKLLKLNRGVSVYNVIRERIIKEGLPCEFLEENAQELIDGYRARAREYNGYYCLKHPGKALERKKKQKTIIRRFLKEYKEARPCKDCGGFFPSCCMDFDHIGNDKYRGVGDLVSASLYIIKKEIDKCELVCSNCHRIRTHLEKNKAHDTGFYLCLGKTPCELFLSSV